MIYYLSVFFSILFILFIIRLVRKKKLEEKYSMMWLIAGIIILLVSLFPNIIVKISSLVGVYYPPSLMFLLAIIILGACLIHVSVVITKQNKMIVRLNQEVGILKEKLGEKESEKSK